VDQVAADRRPPCHAGQTGSGAKTMPASGRTEWTRILPRDVEVAVTTAGHHQVGWPMAEHLVGDPIAFQASVLRLGLHCRRLRHERANSHDVHASSDGGTSRSSAERAQRRQPPLQRPCCQALGACRPTRPPALQRLAAAHQHGRSRRHGRARRAGGARASRLAEQVEPARAVIWGARRGRWHAGLDRRGDHPPGVKTAAGRQQWRAGKGAPQRTRGSRLCWWA
jgi:hypothetical protein